jgi:hypothetical protein
MKRGESHVTGTPTGDGSGSGKAAGEDGREEKRNQMSKAERGRNSSFSEKPVRSRPRRLADWINPTGVKKVHSLIDKVYKQKACSGARLNPFFVIPATLNLRERCMREICTCSVSGGRRPARG